MCNLTQTVVEETRDDTIEDKLVNAQLLTNDSFIIQMDALVNKLYGTLETYVKPSQGFKLIMHNYSSTKANTFSYTYRRISYWYT
jgi:hypothetical protein